MGCGKVLHVRSVGTAKTALENCPEQKRSARCALRAPQSGFLLLYRYHEYVPVDVVSASRRLDGTNQRFLKVQRRRGVTSGFGGADGNAGRAKLNSD